jgi:uncharacterized protein (TIGR02466 family)
MGFIQTEYLQDNSMAPASLDLVTYVNNTKSKNLIITGGIPIKLPLILDLFKDIKRAISNTIGAYCERVKIQTENLKFSGSWLNRYEEHGYQDLHTHADSVLSGVFYLKSAGEKDLIFQAPWHFFQPCQPEYTEQNLDNCHNVEYASVEGRCFIFPSHLMHRTLPATTERMSLSFNIVYR